MGYDLTKNVFSSREAYLSVIKLKDDVGGGIWIRSLIHPEWGTGRQKISTLLLKLIPTTIEGHICGYSIEANATFVKLNTIQGYIKLSFEKYNTIRISTYRAALFAEFGHQNNQGIIDYVDDKQFSLFYHHLKQDIHLKVQHGNININEELKRIRFNVHANDMIEFSFWPRNLKHPEVYTHFKDNHTIDLDYQRFKSFFITSSDMDELAVYHLWMLPYVKVGLLQSDTIAVSKNHMSLIWSWDHLLNAFALMHASPKLGWDTVFLFLYMQKPDGMLPDAVNPVTCVDWYTKPPVYGYFLNKYEKHGFYLPKDKEQFVYESLVKLTHWWIKSNDSFPVYQKPFDSGWDNATCFDDGGNATTPDLVSYLIIQMDYLCKLASRLSKDVESMDWARQRDKLLSSFISTFWNGNEFMYRNDKGEVKNTTSLIRMIPLILEHLLPMEVAQKMIDELKLENHFLAPNGFATESIRSALYDSRKGDVMKPNAYWRGPVWAPPMYMICESLSYFMETELENKAKRRYINTIEKSGAFFEDYDAIHHIGYDDISYGWTVATYTLFKKLRKTML